MAKKEDKKQDLQTKILLGLLAVMLFLLGYLFARVQQLEKFSVVTNVTPTPQAGTYAAQNPGTPVNVGVGHLPPKGDKNAKVKIVEFADFRCPFCKMFFDQTESRLIQDYINTGKAVFYFRQLPILGPASTLAANAAECANEQGKFWEMHDYLYKNQPPENDTSMYTVDRLTEIAASLGISTAQFKNCLSSSKYQNNLDKDLSDGKQAGVSGTPTVFINGEIIKGAQAYEKYKTIIEKNLK
jgi:protein-disulfide isomerase